MLIVKKLARAAASVLVASSLWADTLRLNNSSSVQGTLMAADTREITFVGTDGVMTKYPIGAVFAIEFTPAPPPPPAAARKPAPSPAPSAAPRRPKVTVPVGTQISVRMIDNVDAAATGAGQTYRASIDDPVAVGDQVVIPRGANCTVQVVQVKGTNEMALKLQDISIGGKVYSTGTEYANLKAEGASKKKKALRRGVGLGALGAGIGGLAGGGEGAAIGAIVGVGVGAISGAAAKGPHLKVPSETRLTFALKSPLPMG